MFRYFLMVIALLSITSCGTFESATQVENNSFIQLTGAYLDTNLIIDNQDPIVVDKNTKAFKLEGKQVVKFAVVAGNHVIKIVKNGQTIINRKVFVSEGNVVEVIVP